MLNAIRWLFRRKKKPTPVLVKPLVLSTSDKPIRPVTPTRLTGVITSPATVSHPTTTYHDPALDLYNQMVLASAMSSHSPTVHDPVPAVHHQPTPTVTPAPEPTPPATSFGDSLGAAAGGWASTPEPTSTSYDPGSNYSGGYDCGSSSCDSGSSSCGGD